MDLLDEIKRALTSSQNPETVEDLVSDIALLVIQGRIEQDRLKEGIAKFLPTLRRKYRTGDDVSIDAPLGDSTLTLKDVSLVPSTPRKTRCPNCRKKVKPGNTYCGRGCSLILAAHRRRLIDPKELEHLHKIRWLGRMEIATILGVTRHAVNNIISRYNLSRELPDICKVVGCGKPAVHFKHCKGWMAGNLCQDHRREKQREYMRSSRARRKTPLTAEQRREHARKASIARWSKPEWQDAERRTEFANHANNLKLARLSKESA